MATVARKLTTEDLLAMPDDGVERWLIRGELREKPPEESAAIKAVRTRHHCETVARVAAAVQSWLTGFLNPPGRLRVGEACPAPGVDAEYGPLTGPSMLAVIVPAPKDFYGQVWRATNACLDAGVMVVWVANPGDRTVTVYHAGGHPRTYSHSQAIPEHPAMPGFAPRVADLFE